MNYFVVGVLFGVGVYGGYRIGVTTGVRLALLRVQTMMDMLESARPGKEP